MKKFFLYLLAALFAFVVSSQQTMAQCNVTNTGTAAAPTCTNQNLSLGAGESKNMAFTSGYYYDFSFTNNAQSSGICIGGTRYTAATTLNSLTGTVAVGMWRNTATWNSSSATFTYRLSTPTVPGTPTIASNGCTQVTVQWAASTNAIGYDVQLATNSGFTTLVSGNNCGGVACNGTVNVGNVTSINLTGLAANTTYYFKVRARNGGTPCYSGYSSTLTFTTAANASITSYTRTDAGEYCIGGSGTITVNRAGGTGTYTYTWGGSGSGTAQSTVTSTTNNSTPNTYTYNVTVTPSGIGCAAASGSTTMSSYADPVITAPTGGDDICKGASLTLGGSASGGVPSAAYTYVWQLSGSNVSNGTPNAFTYTNTSTANMGVATTNASTAAPGAYNYTYYVTQARSGCQSSSSTNGTINLANDPTATINAPYGGAINCVPQSGVTLGVTVAGGVDQVYNWQRYDNPTWTNVQATSGNYTTGTLANASTLYRFVFTGGPG
ncbi:MAG: fibronectin type III domain-containing protein [Bacteroidetes bacterium]|nr:fibronectin type III domain-containing protein [Bacteroidota bacterium]